MKLIVNVSKKQSAASHERIVKRVNYLLNRHINRIMGSLNNEKDALFSIAEFPKLILSERLSDFCLTQEPFFRSLLRSWAKFMLSKLTKKMRIAIPPSLGRSTFGIVDESGLLQSGQVFIRYTVDCFDKLSQVVADKQIYRGKVLITKNSAVVSAVDCVALRNLCDVVVFPRYGPRPHPDEMAGSDLDGDKYSVIWDPDLLFDHNEPAFDVGPKNDGEEPLMNENELQSRMIRFFVDYISQDSIGHLANSDLYGIDTEHCNNIALKHNAAVDFPKTGIAPPPLRRRWNDDLPPERAERWPDFMGKKQRISYHSQNLMVFINFRAVEDIETVLRIAEEVSNVNQKLKLDNAFVIGEGYNVDSDDVDQICEFVKAQHLKYCFELQNLLQTYGIGSEGELFSGHFSKFRRKNTDSGGDNDDLSLFNTTGIVSQRLQEIFVSFRTNFYDFFPGGQNYLETAQRVRINFDSAEILGQVCARPSKQMCDVAVMYYNYAYTNQTNRFLSFAWLVWDVLAYVKKQYILDHNIKLPLDPLAVCLTKHIHSVINSNDNAIKRRIEDVVNMINSLCVLLVFLWFWTEKHALKIDILNFYALVLCISNGMIYPDIDEFTPWLEPVDFIHAPTHQIDLTGKIGRIGRDLAAFTSYYHLSLTDTKFVLPQSSSTQLRAFYDSISVIPKDLPSAQKQYNDMTQQVYDKFFKPV
uniref:RNA-dependent RNA polymerase n=1 Tax=Panagrolaimus davidi TaxID=227884 RepID=A0A914PUN6_9BILA